MFRSTVPPRIFPSHSSTPPLPFFHVHYYLYVSFPLLALPRLFILKGNGVEAFSWPQLLAGRTPVRIEITALCHLLIFTSHPPSSSLKTSVSWITLPKRFRPPLFAEYFKKPLKKRSSEWAACLSGRFHRWGRAATATVPAAAAKKPINTSIITRLRQPQHNNHRRQPTKIKLAIQGKF